MHERHLRLAESEAVPAPDSSFDQDELIAVAGYLARTATEQLEHAATLMHGATPAELAPIVAEYRDSVDA